MEALFAMSESGLCLDGADPYAERVYRELKSAVLQGGISPAQASEDAAKAFTRNPDLVTDPYCYPGTSVLLNLMDIRDSNHLQEMGEFVTSFHLYELYANLPAPPYDLGCLLEIHRKLFGNIYGFAGKLREYPSRLLKRRSDGSRIAYQDVSFLEMHLAGFFEELAKEEYLAGLDLEHFAERAAYFYSRID